MKLATKLMGFNLEHPLMGNAGGTCKTPSRVKALALSACPIIVVGSITKEMRPGNASFRGDRVFYKDPEGLFSLNSIGLENGGEEYYRKVLPDMVEIAHANNKKLVANVAGFSPDQNVDLTRLVRNSGADGVEINLGCPNVWGPDGKQKKIPSFDQDFVRETLHQVRQVVPPAFPIAVKLSPFSNPWELEEIAKVIAGSGVVKAVVTSNTFPNGLAYDDAGKPVITFGDGLAGYAGKGMLPIVLGQIFRLRKFLPPEIDIIGVGGVTCGKDVADMQKAGATAVQVGTEFYSTEDPNLFSRLLSELVETLEKRGMTVEA